MTDDLHDRIRRLLDEAEERSESLDTDPGSDAAEAFGDLPERANELVSEADPAELLEAVDSDADTGEDPPENLADAIARSDPDELVELRKLLALSRMADAEDEDARAEHVESFRELSREEDAVEGDESEESDGTQEADAGEATEGPSPDETGDDPSGSAEATDDDDRLREALLGEVEGIRERVQTARAELEDESEGESDGDDSGEEAEDEGAEEPEPEASGEGRGSPGSDGTMFSTVPSRNRSDMRGPDRFSTVRRK